MSKEVDPREYDNERLRKLLVNAPEYLSDTIRKMFIDGIIDEKEMEEVKSYHLYISNLLDESYEHFKDINIEKLEHKKIEKQKELTKLKEQIKNLKEINPKTQKPSLLEDLEATRRHVMEVIYKYTGLPPCHLVRQ